MFDSFIFLIKCAFKSIFKNWLLTLASVTVLTICLVTLGSSILLFDNVSVVSAEQRALSENGTFKLATVGEGTATISVMFLDEDGMHVETLGFTVTVK